MDSGRSDAVFSYTNAQSQTYEMEINMSLSRITSETKEEREEKHVQNMYQFAHINIFQ